MKKSAKKYRNALIVMVVLVFGSVSLALAGPSAIVSQWQSLVYDGMVRYTWVSTVDEPYVIEDTGVFVTNPNPVPVKAWISIFNKYGMKMWSGPLWNTVGPSVGIPPMGFAWMPLSWAILNNPDPDYVIKEGRQKFTYRITMSKPQNVKRPLTCVVEVKQVIYDSPIADPLKMLGLVVNDDGSISISKIKSWCETNPVTWRPCFILKPVEPLEQ